MKRTQAAIILCIIAATASCGGRSDGGADDSVPPLPASPTVVRPRDDQETPPAVADLPSDERSGGMESVYSIVLGILDENCGACHGRPSEANANAMPGPLEFTDDLTRMVALGIIEPLNGASSPLIRVMLDGSMPPPDVEPRPAESDVIALRQFIDNPNFWPELPPAE